MPSSPKADQVKKAPDELVSDAKPSEDAGPKSASGRLRRPYIFRDPIHGDIAFARDGFHNLVRKIVDEEMFQRLRGIKQNGVLNLVFHGAEHSRFTHSLGAAHLAGRMYDAACQNSSRSVNSDERKFTTLAALLHDVGHGPFSHLLEEVLGKQHFYHEKLTVRILTEPSSRIHKHLLEHDTGLPGELLPFVEYQKRKQRRWYYAIVSSQLDADRLDYTARDATMSGVVSHRFDRDRLIGALYVWPKPLDKDDPSGRPPKEYLAVDDRARDVVENYLLALYHLYRSIYFHHTVRAASWLLTAALRRARELASNHTKYKKQLFSDVGKQRDPLWAVMQDGSTVPLEDYIRLDEAHVWGLVQRWRDAQDPTLRDLCDRLKRRRYLKAMPLPAALGYADIESAKDEAIRLVKEVFPHLEPSYYVHVDEIDREGYKPYKWGRNDDIGADPILLVSKSGDGHPIEDEVQDEKSMLKLLDARFSMQRLIVPDEVRKILHSKAR